jgi:hypothetical protein
MLLYCLPLLCKVGQRGCLCCGCFIVYHYFLRFDRGSCCCGCYIAYLWCLRLDRGSSCCGCYIVYHCCLTFDRGGVHIVVVILSTITVKGLTDKWFMFLLVILSTITV